MALCQWKEREVSGKPNASTSYVNQIDADDQGCANTLRPHAVPGGEG